MSSPDPGAMRAPFDAMETPMWDAPDAVRFRGAGGVAWRVVEWPSADVPGSRRPWCLIYLSHGVARRVWDYPPDWRVLSPAELEALAARP